MAEEVKILFLKGECVLKGIRGDLCIGAQFTPLLQTGGGDATEPTSKTEGTELPEFCTTTKRYIGYKLSQAIMLSPAAMAMSAKVNPPRMYLPYNAMMAVMVQPVLGLLRKVDFPKDQRELQLDFSKNMMGAEEDPDSSGVRCSSVQFGMVRGKWYKEVANQGQMPMENPIYFGHIIIPVAVTVPGGTDKARKKSKGPGNQEFNEFMTNAVFYSQSVTKKGTGHGYMGFHFSPHNRSVNFEKPARVKTTSMDFVVKRSNEDEDCLWRGFRVVHSFGLVHKDFQFRRVRFPRRSDGVVVEGRQGPVYANVFKMYKFTMKDIRRPLAAIPETNEEAEDKVAEKAQEV